MNLSGISSSTIHLTDQQPAGLPWTGYSQYNLNSCTSETEQLVNQLDHLFGYRKPLNKRQEEQINELFDDIDALLFLNSSTGLNLAQQEKLDELFDEVDAVYEARNFDSLNQQEQQIVNRLLDQLDKSLD